MLQMATAPAVDVAMAMAVTMVVNIRKETVKRPKFQVALRRRSIVELTWPRVVQNVLRQASISALSYCSCNSSISKVKFLCRGINFGMEEHGAMENATGPDVLVVSQKSDKRYKF